MSERKEGLLSINFHVTEQCNMRCRYCFAQYATPGCSLKIPTLGQYHKIIDQVAAEKFSKISFAGGEPLLHRLLPDLIRHAKNLDLTTMLITNGSLITSAVLREMHDSLDWVSVSVDSLSEERNRRIGRLWQGRGMSEADYRERVRLIKEAGMRLKINTVVSSANNDELLARFIDEINPERWKLFQALPLSGVNTEKAKEFFISEESFRRFIERNGSVRCPLVPESNGEMLDSYAMIDPLGRLYGNTNGRHCFSRPLYEISLQDALLECGFNRDKFFARGGEYPWK